MKLNHSLPSPASSPSPNSADFTTQPSRKRQRSHSMQSDTSSASFKRSISDGNALDAAGRSSQTDQPSALSTDINEDIDSYMAEQGEADIPVTLSSQSPRDNSPPPTSSVEKVMEVTHAKTRPMQIGDTWYLVSRAWWKRWKKACMGDIDKEGFISEKDIGPVDNSPLLDEFGRLKMGLVDGVDVEFVPATVWSGFALWYGEPKHPLPRKVIGRGQLKSATVELHPPTFKVMRLLPKDAEVSLVDSPAKSVAISVGETTMTLCQRLAETVSPGYNAQTEYRVWAVGSSEDQPLYHEMQYESMMNIERLSIEESTKTIDEAGYQMGDAFVVEFKQPDGWILPQDSPGPNDPPALASASRSGIPMPMFNSGEGFFNQLYNTISPTTQNPSKPEANKPSFSSSMMSTGIGSWGLSNRSTTRTIEVGTLGLANMGNTCFMNSALQCLAHTQELSDYFLSGVYQDELNPDNPLGMHGAIAEAFGALLQKIWAENSSITSYSPREFKMQLQRFAPQFSGYQQHDSQELVAFLLDGLHEDLNRVLNKPYVEKPDWEGGGDLELVQLANKSWEGYMMRNDSVIVDLFQGQYQSTLVCPECEKVSITFDPFMYLTLPLPLNKKWAHTIYYVPWERSNPHVMVPVELPGNASFKDLRTLLGRWMNANPENLLTLEVFSHRFYKYLNDLIPVADVTENDTIVCFELPCNSQQSPKYKKHPDDPLLLPLFLCEASPAARPSYLSNRPNPFGYPCVVAITQEQAKTAEGIYDACVDRLIRWTDQPEEFFTWEDIRSDAGDDDTSPIQINGLPTPAADSLTEITEDGFVKVQDVPLEGDITEERGMVIVNSADDDEELDDSPKLKNLGTKKGLFELRLQANQKLFGTMQSIYNTTKIESIDKRLEEADTKPVLLREGDGIYCEFDEHRKSWFFGDEKDKRSKPLWERWTEFKHAELIESQNAQADKKKKTLTLQHCLEEFTREEKLGEDDLWYCPRCKKHQQATKRFDLWKAPDILVVHLKRFSNTRTLRDKIDDFISFPTEGLDLSDMVGERAAAKRLKEQGVNVEELNLGDTEEPLIYDLYGVDEHMGGLGGGHYRAYAQNHVTDKWYHFDDSYVNVSKAADSVNANAYLLFYRRRSSKPLGGKTHEKIEAAKLAGPMGFPQESPVSPRGLPTPPDDDGSHHDNMFSRPFASAMGTRAQSLAPSSPDDPVDFDTSQGDELISDGSANGTPYHFSHISNQASPTSSNEAEADTDLEEAWRHESSPNGSLSLPTWGESPSPSTLSDSGALFTDSSAQPDHPMDVQSPGQDFH